MRRPPPLQALAPYFNTRLASEFIHFTAAEGAAFFKSAI
jgi:hypothetical protein